MSFSPLRWLRRTARSVGIERPIREIYSALGLDRARRNRQRKAEAEFQSKYGERTRYEVEFESMQLAFTTEDSYSKHFFYPKFEGKIFEERVTKMLLHALDGKKCFVDVGANLGWFTCLAAKRLKDGEVHGFELDQHIVTIANRNIEINKLSNAVVHHIALSDHTGTVRYLPKPTLSSDANRIATSVDLRAGGTLVEVPSMRMDDFFSTRDLLPDLIKIDVQGAEFQVLQGMKEIVKRAKPTMFLELHPTELPGFHSTPQEVVRLLFQWGYRVEELPEMRSFGETTELREVSPQTIFRDTTMLIVH